MKNKIVLVLSILFGVMMLNSGLNKFFQFMPMPEMSAEAGGLMVAFAASGWMFPLIALGEIIGGILIAVPKTRALGALVLFPIVVGIFLFHAVLDPATVGMSIVLLAINLFVIWDNKTKYMPMISK
jgi:uncharacterized membrane protein YphA (DoxX/SURF4 family)